MSNPYLGEIRMFAGNFAPVGWAFCDGSILQLSDNDALFTLLGTNYGGDGQTTFGLPDLRGRAPIHFSVAVLQASSGGLEQVGLDVNHIPTHSHALLCVKGSGNAANPAGAIWAGSSSGDTPYTDKTPEAAMGSGAIAPTGGQQPHSNLQPFLAVNFLIALEGIYPSQN